jgi:hypothetical protein
MPISIKNKFSLGQMVFLVSDTEQCERQVVYIVVYPTGLVYGLGCNGENTEHYDIEISEDKRVI